MPALGWSAPRSTRVASLQVGSLGPGRELEVDGEAERPGQLAQLREPVDLAGTVRVGQLRDDVPGTELRAGLQVTLEVARVVVRSDPRELDVEHLDAGRGQPYLGRAHQRRVGGERVVRLVGRDPGQPQSHVAVAGVGRGVHQLGRRQAERREVRERVLVTCASGVWVSRRLTSRRSRWAAIRTGAASVSPKPW